MTYPNDEQLIKELAEYEARQKELEEIFERRKEERRKEDLPFEGEDRRVAERRQKPEEPEERTTIEFAGMSFTGGKAFALVTALSTLGGGAWGGFEIYKDYMDMKEIIQNIDTTEIENRNRQIEIKLDEALTRVDEAVDYSRAIKNDLRDDFNRMEKNVDRVEDSMRAQEDKVKGMIDRANERFDLKRDSMQSDTNASIEALETRLTKKIQQALDNPLAN